MATSPIADNYIENIKNRAFTGYSTAGASNRPVVPDPFADDDTNRSFLQFKIGGGGGGGSQPSSPEREDNNGGSADDILGQTLQGIGVPDPRPDKDFPDTIAGYIESKIVDYMSFPTAINPLTQTERVTGVPKAFSMFMGLPMMGLMSLAAKASQANLENIQEQAIAGKKGYSVGLLNNSIVGISPGPLGFGSVQSGMYGAAPPGLTQAQHDQNVQAALEAHAAEITQGQAIPDITGTYNDVTFGSPDGANALANTTGMVFSYTENPFGKPGMMKNPVMTKENLPVTMGGFKSSDFGFDPDFGYDPYDDTNPVEDTAFFDDELDVTPEVTSDISTTNEYGDPTAPGGGEFGGSSPSSGNTGNTGTTGNTGSTSMGPNSGMSGPGDMGGDGDDGKIVCTAINLTYGLPMYTNKVWLAYNRKHNLDGAWELGYHKLFYPLVKRMNTNRLIHNFLIWFAKTRTHGVKEHMRGNKFTVRTLFLKPVLGSIVYLTGKAIQAGLLKKVEVDVKSLISKNISKQDR